MTGTRLVRSIPVVYVSCSRLITKMDYFISTGWRMDPGTGPGKCEKQADRPDKLVWICGRGHRQEVNWRRLHDFVNAAHPEPKKIVLGAPNYGVSD